MSLPPFRGKVARGARRLGAGQARLRPHRSRRGQTPIRAAPPPTFPEIGEGNAVHPPIASTSRATNPLTPFTFQKLQRHQPSWLGPVPDSCPSRRWGGRRIQRLDVGGLWSSDEARGMETSGVLAGVDGWRPPARRALPARTADGLSAVMSAARHRPQGRRRDPVRSELRATTRMARGKRLRGAGLLRRNGNNYPMHRARPGRPAPSPTRRESRRR